MKFKHIILTRFNSEKSARYNKGLDESWIQARWKLFQEHTLPSLMVQTNTNFSWCIECHPESPELLRNLIAAAASKLPDRFVFSFGCRDEFRDREQLDKQDIVLATRIDSDDAFHRDAVKRIQDAIWDVDILNFETGYQYDLIAGRLALLHRDSSPFSTKINRRANGDDPFDLGGEHTFLSQRYSYKDISQGDPLFCQLLHRDNLANQWGGNPFLNRYLSGHLLKQCFAINQSHYSPAERYAQYLRVFMSQIARQSTYTSDRVYSRISRFKKDIGS